PVPPPAAAASEEPLGTGPVTAPAPSPAPRRLQTEFPFELPRGYVDDAGTLHREGVMRLATARDELVITRLGTLSLVHDGVVENMFASDLAFLQDFYRQINAEGHTRAAVECPHCAEPFEIDLGGSRLGES
ncbi:hypothetical protein, partial [Streptomyces sp. NEAU-H3]|uniref:hypothetical protein n=1 Tax=Streptomyces sp. NEAU-H3 TaxID=2720636 RepID=UPI00143900E2